jgi:hypothetical protein
MRAAWEAVKWHKPLQESRLAAHMRDRGSSGGVRCSEPHSAYPLGHLRVRDDDKLLGAKGELKDGPIDLIQLEQRHKHGLPHNFTDVASGRRHAACRIPLPPLPDFR